MKDVKIISIDNRGRIVIPLVTRKSLGLTTDSQLMLVSDSEAKEIKITPVGISSEEQPIKFRIKMEDVPGALAKIASTFGNLGISLIYGESVIVEKDKIAIWTVISQTPKSISLEELREELIEKGEAINVEILPLE
jgi:bifunctional DNA-binding transcriptional regulator/antitoxin component of YhaV-PrlF toxin-antitoxin module